MQPIVTDGVAWSVCLSVGLSVAVLSPAKTAEPIEMPFAVCVWTRISPKNVLNGVQIPHTNGQCEGENVICTENGWLKEQDQQFSTTESDLWRNARASAFQLQETVLKSDKI